MISSSGLSVTSPLKMTHHCLSANYEYPAALIDLINVNALNSDTARKCSGLGG